MWSYFLATCAQNLHVVLCMSPAGDALRNRCRNFPGLIGSTYIDWVFPWPQQALSAVAKLFLTEHSLVSSSLLLVIFEHNFLDLPFQIPSDYRENIMKHVVYVHSTMHHYSKDYLQKLRRNNYVTPKHYLDYINTYLKLLGNTFITLLRD